MHPNPDCEACGGSGTLLIAGGPMPCSFCERVELPKQMLQGTWNGGTESECGFCSGSGVMIDPTSPVNLIPCVHCNSPVKACETCLGKGKIQDAHGAWYACTYCRPKPPPDPDAGRPRLTVFLTDKDGFKIETTIWLDILPTAFPGETNGTVPLSRRDRLAVELFVACAGELNGPFKLNDAGKKIVGRSIEGMFPEISPGG